MLSCFCTYYSFFCRRIYDQNEEINREKRVVVVVAVICAIGILQNNTITLKNRMKKTTTTFIPQHSKNAKKGGE